MKAKALVIAAVALFVSASSFAQKNLPADFTHDGFFSVGVGANLGLEGVLSHAFNSGIAPVVTVNLGKWCTPSVGFRVGYEGFKTRTKTDWLNNNAFHADVLWNVLNTFTPYDKARFYSVCPYLQGGFMTGKDTGTALAGGAGLLNIFRINDRFAIDLDLRGSFVKGEQVGGDGRSAIGSITVGLQINLPAAR